MRNSSNQNQPEGQAARNDAGARSRLIDAGTRLFGIHGFDAVRTRTLADEARVNQSAIPYYFGGKKGLYLAVAEYLAGELNAQLADAVKGPVARFESMSRDEAVAELESLMIGFARNRIGDHDTDARATFLAREQLQPTDAFEVLFDQFFEPLHVVVSALVGRITGREPDASDTITTAHALVGQVLAFAVAKHTYLRRQGVSDLTPDHVESIATTVAALAVHAVV